MDEGGMTKDKGRPRAALSQGTSVGLQRLRRARSPA